MAESPSIRAARERERAFKAYVSGIAGHGIRLAELVALNGGRGGLAREIEQEAELLLSLAAIDGRHGNARGSARAETIYEIWRKSGVSGFIAEIDAPPDAPEPYAEERMESTR